MEDDMTRRLAIEITHHEHPEFYEFTVTPEFRQSAYIDANIKFKVRKLDLENKGWNINSTEFWQYLNNGLITVIAWDFDLTLSNIHTAKKGSNTTADNLKCGEQLIQRLQQINDSKHCISIIITKNSKTLVQHHLQAWGIETYFQEIYGRNEISTSGKQKGFCTHDNTINNQSSIHDGFLDLNAPEKPIAMIDAILIDDDNGNSDVFRLGVTFILANKEPNDVNHLTQLDNLNLFDGVVEQDLLTSNSKSPNTDLFQINNGKNTPQTKPSRSSSVRRRQPS